jgi:hypothetical protein
MLLVLISKALPNAPAAPDFEKLASAFFNGEALGEKFDAISNEDMPSRFGSRGRATIENVTDLDEALASSMNTEKNHTTLYEDSDWRKFVADMKKEPEKNKHIAQFLQDVVMANALEKACLARSSVYGVKVFRHSTYEQAKKELESTKGRKQSTSARPQKSANLLVVAGDVATWAIACADDGEGPKQFKKDYLGILEAVEEYRAQTGETSGDLKIEPSRTLQITTSAQNMDTSEGAELAPVIKERQNISASKEDNICQDLDVAGPVQATQDPSAAQNLEAVESTDIAPLAEAIEATGVSPENTAVKAKVEQVLETAMSTEQSDATESQPEGRPDNNKIGKKSVKSNKKNKNRGGTVIKSESSSMRKDIAEASNVAGRKDDGNGPPEEAVSTSSSPESPAELSQVSGVNPSSKGEIEGNSALIAQQENKLNTAKSLDEEGGWQTVKKAKATPKSRGVSGGPVRGSLRGPPRGFHGQVNPVHAVCFSTPDPFWLPNLRSSFRTIVIKWKDILVTHLDPDCRVRLSSLLPHSRPFKFNHF